MTRLVRAELLKLRTIRTPYGLFVSMLALVALSVIVHLATHNAFDVATEGSLRTVFGLAGESTIFALILGLLAVTGEFRHGTITQTFLTTPVRERIVAAKLLAYTLAGLAFGVAAEVLTFAIALPWLSSEGVGLGALGGHRLGIVVLGVLLSSTLGCALGVGFGALVRNQVGAIVAALIWLFVGENVISIIPHVAKYTPGRAITALSGGESSDLLTMRGGGLVMLGYVLFFGVLGAVWLVRRDVS